MKVSLEDINRARRLYYSDHLTLREERLIEKWLAKVVDGEGAATDSETRAVYSILDTHARWAYMD